MKPQRGVKTPKRMPKTPAKTPRTRQGLTNTTADPVHVFCRLRPLAPNQTEVCCKPVSSTLVDLTPPELSHAARNGNIRKQQYKFKYVFDDTTSQQGTFDHVAFPLVKDLIMGKNGVLFTYGVTGSGKTYTMTGTPTDPGIMPRALDVLFNSIGNHLAGKYTFCPNRHNGMDIQSEAEAMLERQRKDILTQQITKPAKLSNSRDFTDKNRVQDCNKVSEEDVASNHVFAVFVSYVQIYNTFVYDLLEETPKHGQVLSKVIREDGNGVMFVQGVVEVEVRSTEEAFDVLNLGNSRRKTACTSVNEDSSRSHSIFTVRVVQAPVDVGGDVCQDKAYLHVNQLALVDLAGSERTTRTGNRGDRLREAGNINTSLMALRACIEALRENQQNPTLLKPIPYRNSKLTHLFKNYFDGDGKVKMIVCVNPAANEYDETIHVVRFAELTADVLIQRSQQVRFEVPPPALPQTEPGYRHRGRLLSVDVPVFDLEDDAGTDLGLHTRLASIRGEQFPVYALPRFDGVRLEIQDVDDDVTLPALRKFLVDRGNKAKILHSDVTTEARELRLRLVTMDTTLDTLTKERDRLAAEGEEERRQHAYLVEKCGQLEQEMNLLRNHADSEKYALTRKDRLLKDKDTKLLISEEKLDRITKVLRRSPAAASPAIPCVLDGAVTPTTTASASAAGTPIHVTNTANFYVQNAGTTPVATHTRASQLITDNESPITPGSVKARAQQFEHMREQPRRKRLSEEAGGEVDEDRKKRRS